MGCLKIRGKAGLGAAPECKQLAAAGKHAMGSSLFLVVVKQPASTHCQHARAHERLASGLLLLQHRGNALDTLSSVHAVRPTAFACIHLQVPVQYQQELLDSLDASAASVEEVDNSSSTSTIIAQVGRQTYTPHAAHLCSPFTSLGCQLGAAVAGVAVMQKLQQQQAAFTLVAARVQSGMLAINVHACK